MPKRNIIPETRFHEEIFEEYLYGDEHKYSITLNKECANPKDEQNHFIGDSRLCWYCYYREFLAKLRKLQPVLRQDFLIYQLSLRKDKPRFLRDVLKLIKNNESWLNEHDYSNVLTYEEIIEELSQVNLSGLKQKIDNTLELLYQNRQNPNFLHLRDLLTTNGYFLSENELFQIGKHLETDGYVDIEWPKEGPIIRISSEGVLACEEEESSAQLSDPISNSEVIDTILEYIDQKFLDARIEELENFQTMEELVDEIQEDLQAYCSKPTTLKLVRMRLSEAVLKGIVSKSLVEPLLESTIKLLS